MDRDYIITITMKTGNDAFMDAADVAEALRRLADKLDDRTLDSIDDVKIMDGNGQSVGKVEVKTA